MPVVLAQYLSLRGKLALPYLSSLALLLLSGGVVAGGLQSGDGSLSDNPDLSAHHPGSECVAGCPLLTGGYYVPPVVVSTDDQLIPSADLQENMGGGAIELAPVWPTLQNEPIPPQPLEPVHPYYDIDWSVAVQGTRNTGSAGEHYAVSVAPSLSLTHTTLRGQYALGASANLGVSDTQLTRVEDFSLTFDVGHALNSVTGVSLAAQLTVGQEDVNAPGISDDVLITPVVGDASVEVALSRQLDNFELELSGDIGRSMTSDTYMVGDIWLDNAAMNSTNAGLGLRLSYGLTPILSPFVEASGNRILFDAAPISTGIKLDGWEYAITSGLVANWQDVLTAEASVGYGVRQFDELSLGDLKSALYALNFTFSPDDDLSFGAAFGTDIDPGDPDAGILARVNYSADFDVNYLVNQIVNLRGILSGSYSRTLFSPEEQFGYSAGVGLDYLWNQHTSFTLDYAYSRALPNPNEYAHEIGLGVTFSR